MRSWFDLVLLVVHLSVASTGLVLYLASFIGYGWERGGEFIGPAFVVLVLSTIPTALRDHRFVKRYWGVGIFAIRYRFPGEFYPARESRWLNLLGWGLFALVGVHFLLMAVASTTHSKNWHAELGYPALIVTVIGVMAALGRMYPPTETPDHVD